MKLYTMFTIFDHIRASEIERTLIWYHACKNKVQHRTGLVRELRLCMFEVRYDEVMGGVVIGDMCGHR